MAKLREWRIYLSKFFCQTKKHLQKIQIFGRRKKLVNGLGHPFPPTVLQCLHAQMVRDSSSSFNIYRLFQLDQICLNPEGRQNCVTGSNGIAFLLKGGNFAYWWSYIGKGLFLQPAHQACLTHITQDSIEKYERAVGMLSGIDTL